MLHTCLKIILHNILSMCEWPEVLPAELSIYFQDEVEVQNCYSEESCFEIIQIFFKRGKTRSSLPQIIQTSKKDSGCFRNSRWWWRCYLTINAQKILKSFHLNYKRRRPWLGQKYSQGLLSKRRIWKILKLEWDFVPKCRKHQRNLHILGESNVGDSNSFYIHNVQ